MVIVQELGRQSQGCEVTYLAEVGPGWRGQCQTAATRGPSYIHGPQAWNAGDVTIGHHPGPPALW